MPKMLDDLDGLKPVPKKYTVNQPLLEIRQTSFMCPEQYEVFYRGQMVAYIRLRHGYLTCECPSVNGDMVFQHHFNDGDRGSFKNNGQCLQFIMISMMPKILRWMKEIKMT